MIKKFLCFGLMTFSSTSLLAQLIELKPSDLQLPRVSALPGCAVADYGKIVFLTTTNRANVCSGSGWVEVATGGSQIVPLVINQTLGTSLVEANNTSIADPNAVGIEGTVTSSTAGIGVLGLANNTAPTNNSVAVQGFNQSTNANGIGVYGRHFGSGYGVFGQSASGYGVYAFTGGGGTGVYGASAGLGNGVWGASSGPGGVGVYGLASSTSIGGNFVHAVSGGVALSTSGKIRFQGNGAAVGKILVCDNVNGNAEWKDVIRTGKLKLGSAAFQSSISSNNSTIGTQGISLTNASTVGPFYANVSLPDGATLSQIKIYYIDNDGVAPATGVGITNYGLQKIIHTSTNAYSTVVSGTPTNTSASLSILSNFQNTTEVIDNQNAFYRFLVTMPVSTNLILVGAEISYSYIVND